MRLSHCKRRQALLAGGATIFLACFVGQLVRIRMATTTPIRPHGISKGDFQLVHVISPYVVSNRSNTPSSKFAPLDWNQWAAMASIRRALQCAPSTIQVELVCAVFPQELQTLQDTKLPCHRYVQLARSTRTEYPTLEPRLDLPFVSDILQSALGQSSNNVTLPAAIPIDEFSNERHSHVMITNADIGLSKHFYSHLRDLLQIHDAVSINRVTLPMEILSTSKDWVLDEDRFLTEQVDPNLATHGVSHPGYDLFCARYETWSRLNTGDFFLGRPPWGASLHLAFELLADHYVNVKSNEFGTFHLGDDMSRWQTDQDIDFGSIPDSGLALLCPEQRGKKMDALGLQNTINCGRWFASNATDYYIHYSKENDFSRCVPSFVQRGYEGQYLQRYPNYLRYTTDGFPRLKGPRGPSNKKKAQGLFTRTKKQPTRKQKGSPGGILEGYTDRPALPSAN